MISQNALDRSLFTKSYRWLLKTNDFDGSMEILKGFKISLESDVSLAIFNSSSIDLYQVYKIHESKEINSYLIGNINKDLEFSPTGIKHDKENLQGFVMNVTFVVSTDFILL